MYNLELPYDRTALSKMSDPVQKPGPIRSAEYLKNNGMVFLGETTVTGIDYKSKHLQVDSKYPITYDKLLIASGCVNKFPPIRGLKETKFSSLRSLADYEEINQAVRRKGVKNVTIIGGGFIGIEIASSIKLALE